MRICARGLQILVVLDTVQLVYASLPSTYRPTPIRRFQLRRQFFHHSPDHWVTYPGHILNNLQQSPLRVEKTSWDGRLPLLASQIVLAENDQWWQRGAAKLAFTHTWTMANIASVGWAVIAYVFTIASMDPSALKVIGPAVACAWLWLLPLVVGWLQTSPNCDEAKLRVRVRSLNQTAYIPGPGDDPAEPPVLARGITNDCAIDIWPLHRPVGAKGE
jgi:hypothetical protein